jgi:methylated-DNA-protein-cysteine methyltransferase-like protein
MPGSTEHFDLIWRTVRAIPRGRVASYGEVAEAAGLPRRARLVGTALRRLPKGTRVPWHRVINAQGKPAFPPGSTGYREQRRRLEAEGVVFMNGRIDFAQYGRRRSLDELLWRPGR